MLESFPILRILIFKRLRTKQKNIFRIFKEKEPVREQTDASSTNGATFRRNSSMTRQLTKQISRINPASTGYAISASLTFRSTAAKNAWYQASGQIEGLDHRQYASKNASCGNGSQHLFKYKQTVMSSSNKGNQPICGIDIHGHRQGDLHSADH